MLSITPTSANFQSNTSNLGVSKTTTCLLKTAIATVSARGRHTKANILFDEGAQRSFVSQKLSALLKLQPRNTENICIAGFGAEYPSNQLLGTANVNVQSLTGEQIPLSALIVPHIATPLHNSFQACVKKIPHLQGLVLAHFVTREENFEISLLIGADHYWDFVEDHIIRGNGPTAMQSKLGYLLSGPLPIVQKTLGITNILHVSATCKVDDQRENFWNAESAGSTNPKEIDTIFLLQYQKSSISREPDGGYTAKFPWKYDHDPLPTNYAICERRTRSLTRRLKQVPGLLEKYDSIIAEQERHGFIEKICSSPFIKHVHYIPHHAVQKASSTTPIRIVYDCSCHQSKDHPSLNDCLMIGPPFQNEIYSIMLRFRFHAITLSTDIGKAFLHVNLDEADCDYTRFLWLSKSSDPESAFQIYRF